MIPNISSESSVVMVAHALEHRSETVKLQAVKAAVCACQALLPQRQNTEQIPVAEKYSATLTQSLFSLF